MTNKTSASIPPASRLENSGGFLEDGLCTLCRITYRILALPANLLITLAMILDKTFNTRKFSFWFSSDVFERDTFWYVWIANQFGHFAIGTIFGVAAILCEIVFAKLGWNISALWWALLFAAFYASKEVADVLSEERRPVTKEKPRVFSIVTCEVASDGLNDTLFVIAGIIVCLLVTQGILASFNTHDAPKIWLSWWVLAALVPLLYWRGSKALPQQQRMDLSALPYYFHLSRFYAKVDGLKLVDGQQQSLNAEQVQEDVRAFIASPSGCGLNGLLIFGGVGSGKTALATAIGTALCATGNQPRYVSAGDLVAERDDDRVDDGCCRLGEAQVFIVDHAAVPIVERMAKEVLAVVDTDADSPTQEITELGRVLRAQQDKPKVVAIIGRREDALRDLSKGTFLCIDIQNEMALGSALQQVHTAKSQDAPTPPPADTVATVR